MVGGMVCRVSKGGRSFEFAEDWVGGTLVSQITLLPDRGLYNRNRFQQ